MSVTSGFFNSRNGDRAYDAVQMSSIFDGVIKDGVLREYGDHFAVTPGSGISVNVGSGRAWFNHTWTLNDSTNPITLESPDMVGYRKDAIVLEVNSNSNTRENSIKAISGPVAASRVGTVAPTLINTTEVHQYPLAYVYVDKAATAIYSSDIENKIGTTACPWTIGVTDDMDKKSVWYPVVVRSSQWSGNNYSFESDYPSDSYDILDLVPYSATTSAQRKAWKNADCGGYYATNVMTANGTKPTVDINLEICVRHM